MEYQFTYGVELSYFGKVKKVMDFYEVKGTITQGEMAWEILKLTVEFLRP